MTPTNTAMTPEIMNIADNKNVKHTVIPTPHTHSQSEIDGLADALAGKAAVDHSHTNIYNDENNMLSVGEGYIDIELHDGESGGGLELTVDNLPNLHRAIQAPDTVPTQSSDKLVTSGGVYSALSGKMDSRQFDSDPTLNSTKLVTSGNIRKAMNAAGAIRIMGAIEDPSFVVAFENYTPWWSNGETELHYILQKSSGSPVAVKTQFRSNTGIVYFSDDLGDVSPSRWPIVTVRRGMNGTTPIFTVTLDGVYTPSK